MRDMVRRLARLEAESAQRRAACSGDHGLSPEGYAVAHAQLTTLFSTPLSDWPPGMLETVKDALSGTGRGGAP